MRYGDKGTIHQSEMLDIETDERGNVVGVWFRCLALPFRQVRVDENRADQMRAIYQQTDGNIYPKIKAIEVTLKSEERKQ
jgi:hypothetical protein